MTNGKLKVLSAAALIAVAGAVQAAVSQPRHVTIEYEYAKDGEIVSRKINGAVQRYEYDLRGQLTGVYDRDGKAVESYTYDAAGNILKKTVNDQTTSFKYDAANQLVSKEDASGTTTYAYDAAGRMVREGGKEYRYSYLDKITSVVENGETAATMDYFVGGQIASVTRGGDAEKFIWDGLALVHRDGSDYLNEPAIGGGNPIASGGKVLFNDMLGSTVAVKGDDGLGMTSMTAFGESGDSGAFFTGKPFIGELGYAFLMRCYRPENGKWQTADPMGYPDGWNQLAYCNNSVTITVDLFGAASITLNAAQEGAGTSSAGGWGHSWFDLTDSLGNTSGYGFYPDDPAGWTSVFGGTYGSEIVGNDSTTYQNTDSPYASVTISITDAQFDAIEAYISSYSSEWSLYNNCTDFVIGALDAAGIPHPSLSTFGVSDPDVMYEWILSIGGTIIE